MGNDSVAEACGGCFHEPAPTENPTVVTDHRMIFSISKDQSTLYDQIEYSGKPGSFAWVLPFAGDIEVGVSSDELFQVLDAQTQTTIIGPPTGCAGPPYCGSSGGPGFSSSSSGAVSGGGVTVLHNEVVGPYETVQLKATDAGALEKWLGDHNYVLQDAVKPIIAAYQSESFNFLAVKLVPGQGVRSMKPIRVTTKGANVALPLRMVAAGTGATVGITLWVVAEGRYEPSSFGVFSIEADDLTWDFLKASSDYTQLRASRTAAGHGKVWEIESSTKLLKPIVLAQMQGVSSTQAYDAEKNDAGVVTRTPDLALTHDLEVLFAGIGADQVTRLRADLSHDALDRDLTLQASASQAELPRVRQVTRAMNAPVCPSYPPCSSSGSTSSSSGDAAHGSNDSGSDDDGCRTSRASSNVPWLGATLAIGLLALSKRRRKKQ